MGRREDSLPSKVAQGLLQRIIANEFAPGSVLPSERELQETYAVSRSVAREAIKLLTARGIVEVHPRQGATVGLDLTGAASDALLLAFHHDNVVQEDLLHVRMVLEPVIVALAAEHATPIQLRRLQQSRQVLSNILAVSDEELLENDAERWGFDDAAYHILLAEMSQNPVYKILIDVLVGLLWKQRRFGYGLTLEEKRRSTQQHLAIADAVIARDAERARAAMTEHLNFTHTHIMSVQNTLQSPMRLQLDGTK